MYLLLFTLSTIFFYLSIKIFKKVNTFPEPPARRIFGHIFEITADLLRILSKFIKQHGKTIQMRLGPSFAPFVNVVLTTDHKLAEFIMSSNKILTKPRNYTYLKAWLRQGLVTSDGSYWRRHRKIVTSTFHSEFLENSVEVFEREGSKFVGILEKYDKADSVDVHPSVALCTLDIICETAMGTEINAQSGENSQYVEGVKEVCRIVKDRCLSPLKVFDATFWLTKDYYIQKEAVKILHDFSSGVINSRREKYTEKEGNKKNFLDLLLKYVDEEKMTLDELQEEVDTIMFGGHDTTASVISFTLFCLANNPQIQKKVLQEQKNLFSDEKNPIITFSELQNMKYLENVIKEGLRLYPAVPILGRYNHEDIEFDGRIIPKGTNIEIFVFGIHRDPDYFPEPEKFNPDRFDNFNPLPYTYMPFSAGPRNCLGQKYAMLEMKSLISKIVRHFDVRAAVPKHELELSGDVVLTSTNGIKVGLVKRD